MTGTIKACPIPGVRTLLESRKRRGELTLVRRMYVCENGAQLWARRGGALDLSADLWEIQVANERGLPIGEPAAFVDDAQLARLVQQLAAWFDEMPVQEELAYG